MSCVLGLHDGDTPFYVRGNWHFYNTSSHLTSSIVKPLIICAVLKHEVNQDGERVFKLLLRVNSS